MISDVLYRLWDAGSRAATETIRAIRQHDAQAESDRAREYGARANANLGLCRDCGRRECFGECQVLAHG